MEADTCTPGGSSTSRRVAFTVSNIIAPTWPACFEALLLDPVLRARFARAAGVSDLGDTTAARLTLLAFLHDFGKLNAGFQFKVRRPNGSSGHRPRPAGHIAEALLGCDQSDMSGLLRLHRMVDEWGDGVVPLVYAMLAHHGRWSWTSCMRATAA